MTGDQSRLLKISARVRWADSITDLGTVAANAWGGVVIKWDDGTVGIRYKTPEDFELIRRRNCAEVV